MGFGIALGYEDVVDHDELRHDPIMAGLAGQDRRSRQAMHDAHKHYVDTIALSLRRAIVGTSDGVASRTSGNASAASTEATTRDTQAGKLSRTS